MKCPFAAHIRKTNPRDDATPDNNVPSHMLLRRAIQFGPEVTAHEKQSQTSDPNHARGLLFVCYQSNLSNGFHFVQSSTSPFSSLHFVSGALKLANTSLYSLGQQSQVP